MLIFVEHGPPDRIMRRLRRLFRVREVELDGFRLVGYRSGVPKQMIHRLVSGAHEGPERRAVATHVRAGDRVLEIGAGMGIVTLVAARAAGPGSVLAFEPNPEAARVARENFRRNGFNIELRECAVGAAAGRAWLASHSREWLGARVATGRAGGVAVAVDGIADVVERFRPTVLVMDVEGMEEELLAACRLAAVRTIVVETHGGPHGRTARLHDRLAAADFIRAGMEASEDGSAVEVWTRPGSAGMRRGEGDAAPCTTPRS